MKNIEYPIKNIYQFVFIFILKFVSISSYIVLLYLILMNYRDNMNFVILSIFGFALFKYMHKTIFIYYTYRNSSEKFIDKFNFGLNKIIEQNPVYSIRFKKFDFDIFKKNLSGRYEELSDNLYYKSFKSDLLITLFTNEPRLKKYDVIFYLYEDSNKEMIFSLPNAFYKILVVHEHDCSTIEQFLTNYEKIFSGIIVYNSNGIVKMRYSYLETFSKNDNFDYYSKFIFRRMKKNYKVLLNQETIKLIWGINKKIL